MAKQKQQHYENTERILRCQKLYNETGDVKYLYEMIDDLRHAVQSIIFKRLKGNPTRTYKDNAQMIAEKWALDFIRRRNKGNPYNMNSPISYAYFMYLRWNPTDDAIINNVEYIDDDYWLAQQPDTGIDYDPYTIEEEDCEFFEITD